MLDEDDELLTQFFGAYFHQDFDLVFGTEAAAIDAFVVGNSAPDVEATAAALERFALTGEPEPALKKRVLGWLGSGADGVLGGKYASYRDWILQLAKEIRRRCGGG